MRQGLAAARGTGVELGRSSDLALLAEAYRSVGQIEEGLGVLSEALVTADKTGERFYEAELYRLKGTLTLQSQVQGPKPVLPAPVPQAQVSLSRRVQSRRS